MTYTSYPSAGKLGYSEAQLTRMGAERGGIINDFASDACALSRLNASDIARVQPGQVLISGHILDITAAEDLYVAPVVTGNPAVTYYIYGVYDPTLDVPAADGTAPANGACRLEVSAGPPPSTGGRVFVTLYTLTRTASQLIAATQLVDYRRWTGPMIEMDSVPAALLTATPTWPVGVGPLSRGTRIYDNTTRITWRVTKGSSGLTLSADATAAAAVPLAAGLALNDVAPAYYFRGRHVHLQGTVKRSSGAALVAANAADTTLGTLPAECRPSSVRRFTAYAGGQVLGLIKVDSDGVISVYGTTYAITWVDLSVCQWEAA